VLDARTARERAYQLVALGYEDEHVVDGGIASAEMVGQRCKHRAARAARRLE